MSEQGKINPFLKAKLAKETVSDPKEANTLPISEKTTSKNPFAAKQLADKQNSASGPEPSKSRNPFAKLAEATAVSSPQTTAVAEAEVSSGSPSLPQKETSASTSSISADEYTHDNQPVQYTPEQAEDLRRRIEQLQEAFGNPKQIGNALRATMIHITEHPALANIMAFEDWGLMVRGLRESYGTVIAKKEDRRGKKKANEEEEAEVAAILGDLDLGFMQ